MNLKFKSVTFVCLILILILINLNCGNKEEQPVTKSDTKEKTETSSESKSSGESAQGNNFHITYKAEGIINGTMDIIKIGDKFKQEMEVDVKGIKSKSDVYVLGDAVYSVTDVAGMKHGFKADLSEYNKKKQIGENFSDFRDLENYLKGTTKKGSEEILGCNCEIYETGKGIFLSVCDNKYVLRIKGPEFTATAINLDKDPSVSSDRFEVPKDVDFSRKNPGAVGKEKVKELMEKYKKQ